MPARTQLDQLLHDFAADLEATVRRQVYAEVTAVLNAALGGRKSTPARGARQRASRPSQAAGKRTPAAIAKLGENLLSYIAAHPGLRCEQIAAGTRLSTAALALPIRRLVAGKKLKAAGVARGTTYTVIK